MIVIYQIDTVATPDQIWELLGRPERWPEWAPHIKHSIGFGPGEVGPGRWGLIFLGGILPISAYIDEVDMGQYWSWQLGPVTIGHRIEELSEGSRIKIEIDGPLLAKAALQLAYQPIVENALANLSSKATR